MSLSPILITAIHIVPTVDDRVVHLLRCQDGCRVPEKSRVRMIGGGEGDVWREERR